MMGNLHWKHSEFKDNEANIFRVTESQKLSAGLLDTPEIPFTKK
jgi:hypothetical protein